MSSRQWIAIVVPPILVGVMYPIFHALAGVFSDRIAWYLGLATYWVLWGAVFPLLIIGRHSIWELVRPQRLSRRILLLVAIPIFGAAVATLIPGMTGCERDNVWILVLLLSTPFANGLFEEVLWRGVYTKLFPTGIFWGVLWPSIWFALWHYVPGSIMDGNPAGLMIGAGVMGLYLAYLTRKTGTVWWAVVAHSLGGIIMIVWHRVTCSARSADPATIGETMSTSAGHPGKALPFCNKHSGWRVHCLPSQRQLGYKRRQPEALQGAGGVSLL